MLTNHEEKDSADHFTRYKVNARTWKNKFTICTQVVEEIVSSSDCFFVLSVAVLLQFLIVSASALTSTKYIDKLCEMQSVEDKTFCLQTLSANPLAASATGLVIISNPHIHLKLVFKLHILIMFYHMLTCKGCWLNFWTYVLFIIYI